MRILFVHVCDSYTPFATAVAALAGALRGGGHELLRHAIPLESSVDQAGKDIAAYGADVVAASFMGRDWPGLSRVFSHVKRETDCFLVAGGYHATLRAEEVAGCRGVDAICVGEGERPFARLIAALARGERPRTGPGLWVRDGESFTGDRPPTDPEPNIADVPRWDYEIFGELSLRTSMLNYLKRDRYMPVRASRGCPFDCIYCDHTIKGYKPRYRSVGHVIDEIKILLDRYGSRIKRFYFWDDILIWDRNWIEEFCRSLLARELRIKWTCNAHVNKVEPRLMGLMKEAGCENVRFGIESGSQ